MPAITKKQLRDLTAESRLPLLFEALSEISDRSANRALSNDLTIIQASYNRLQETIRTRTVRYDDKEITENGIIGSLTELIGHLPGESYEISEQLQAKLQRRARSRSYVLIGLLAAALTGAAVYFSTVPDLNPPAPQQENQPLAADTTVAPPAVDTSAPVVDAAEPAVASTAIPWQIHGLEGSAEYSQLVVGKETFPLAYIDLAYVDGREQEANRLADACYYQFEISNPTRQPVTVQNLFAEVLRYRPIPATAQPIPIQPFEEATVVYILMGKNTRPGANIYRNSFYVIEEKKKIWGKIKLMPQSSERIAVRLNARTPGIYTFQLGVEYYAPPNKSIRRNYILPDRTTWAFQKQPE